MLCVGAVLIFYLRYTVVFQPFRLNAISFSPGKDTCYQGLSVQLLFFMLQPCCLKLTLASETLPFGLVLPLKGEKIQGHILGRLKTERQHGKMILPFSPMLFLGEGLTFSFGRHRENSTGPGQTRPGFVEANACFCQGPAGMGFARNGRGQEKSPHAAEGWPCLPSKERNRLQEGMQRRRILLPC